MPGVLRDGGLIGYKVFNGPIRHGVRYLIAVYDEKTRELLALMDAASLTATRTGATTGIATKYLSPPEATRVGVIGSGLEATTNLQAICNVRPIETGKVFSPTKKHREQFAARRSHELQIRLSAADTPEEAVDGADIVIVATNTTGIGDLIAYRGDWIQPGVHVNSIGSTGLQLRELDSSVFLDADRIVVDSRIQMEQESGDLQATIEAGTYDRSKVTELKEIVSRGEPIPRGPGEVTLFKYVGTAVQDITAGFDVFREAGRRGLGRDIGDLLEHKTF